MKKIKGYLIDRTTGAGISGKTVTFKDLAGADISTAAHGTVYQAKDSTTQSDGSFSFLCELSPGPIQIEVTVGGSEKKERKWDETSQMGIQWGSDVSRIGRAIGQGVIRGYLTELALSIVSGHTFRIAKGAAIVDGSYWSLEDIGGAAGYDILGTTNPSGSINPRLDLVSLRQYKESAAGQLSGKQDVVVTLGTLSNVVPAAPTDATWTTFPIGVLSTALAAGTKTVYADSRTFINPTSADLAPKFAFGTSYSIGVQTALTTSYQQWAIAGITGLDPNKTYDGRVSFATDFPTSLGEFLTYSVAFDTATGPGLFNAGDVHLFEVVSGANQSTWSWPVYGLTGSSSYNIPIRFKNTVGGTIFYMMPHGWVMIELRPRS